MKNMRLGLTLLLLAVIGGGGGAAEQASVTLPYEALRRLEQQLEQKNEAIESLRSAGQPPEAVISTARYEATTHGTALLITARLRVIAFGRGPAVIALFDERGIITAAVLPAGMALNTVEGRSVLRVMAPAGGEVVLRLIIPAEEDGSERRAGFSPPAAGAAVMRLTVPGAGAARLQTSGGEARRRIGNTTVIEAALPPDEEVDVAWTASDGREARTAAPGRINLESLSAVIIDRDLLSGRTRLNYECKGGTAEAFQLAVPLGVRVLDVEGDGFADWEVSDNRGRTVLTLRPAAPVVDRFSAVLTWEFPLGSATLVEVPRLTGLGVEREAGMLGVAAGEGVTVEEAASAAQAIEQLTELDPRAAPASLQDLSPRPFVTAARYLGAEGRLTVVVNRPEAVAVVAARLESLRGQSVLLPTGRLVTLLSAQVRNSLVEYLEVKLPDGARVWNASVNGQFVRPLKGDSEGVIRLPLVRSANVGGGGEVFPLELLYVLDLPAPLPFAGITITPPVMSLEAGRLSWTCRFPRGSLPIFMSGGCWRKPGDDSLDIPSAGLNLLGYPAAALDGPSRTVERYSVDANSRLEPIHTAFATETVGRSVGGLILIASLLLTIESVRRGLSRGRRRGIVLTLLMALGIELIFGQGVIRVVQGVIVAALWLGARRLLAGGAPEPATT